MWVDFGETRWQSSPENGIRVHANSLAYLAHINTETVRHVFVDQWIAQALPRNVLIHAQGNITLLATKVSLHTSVAHRSHPTRQPVRRSGGTGHLRAVERILLEQKRRVRVHRRRVASSQVHFVPKLLNV